jgi:3-oxoacyl-[acyl-carrier-protein] synthase III
VTARAVIVGTGLYAPEQVVTNAELEERLGVEVDVFLREQRNIRERRFMAADQATSDLVVPAAREALTAAGIGAEDLDLIVIATDTPDYISPATASVVQHKLGARRAGTFDLNTACAGFVTALDLAGKYVIADERYHHILVAGAYGMSRYLDWDEYRIATLFADGAGAVVVRRVAGGGGGAGDAAPAPGILASTLYADGSFHDYMGIYAGGTHLPVDAGALERKDHLLRFAKRFPPETNAANWPRLIRETLARAGREPAEVEHFFFTQINIGSIRESLAALGVPETRSHNIMDRYAYTGSACIPMALADAARAHRLRAGDLVVLMGSGGGMAMACVALIWGYDT